MFSSKVFDFINSSLVSSSLPWDASTGWSNYIFWSQIMLNLVRIRPLIVEMLVIIAFYCENLVQRAVIINYRLFFWKISSERNMAKKHVILHKIMVLIFDIKLIHHVTI